MTSSLTPPRGARQSSRAPDCPGGAPVPQTSRVVGAFTKISALTLCLIAAWLALAITEGTSAHRDCQYTEGKC